MAPSAVAVLLPSITPGTGNKSQPAPLSPDNDNEQKPKHVHGMLDKSPLEAISHGGPTLASIPTFPSFAAQRRWQLEHMAAAFRHWSREGYVFGISGHISVRDPERHDAFWTNPLGVHFGLLKASDMVLVNFEGEVVGGNRSRPANAAGFLIHAAVHRARPDVHAAAHCHTQYGKAWSIFGRPLEMLTQDACKFWNAHSVYNNYGGVVLAAEEGDLIAEALRDGKGCILRNHGLLTVGGTVDEAAFLFDVMEHSCRDQLLAEAAAANGLQKYVISDEEARYNFQMESDPSVCYAEFQAYYDYEDHMLKGEFKQ